MLPFDKDMQVNFRDYLLNYNTFNKDTLALKKYMSQFVDYELKGTDLGILFEVIAAPDEDGFSREVAMYELLAFHPNYRTKNGSTWCRDDQSYLGKKYKLKKSYASGSISGLKLEGFNKQLKIQQDIRPDIKRTITAKRCAILDISTNTECDHKDGKKDDWRMNDKAAQKLEDFQPLCKTANDAKRSHCATCKSTGKRYDARKLGYSESFTKGDFDTDNCQGCYWYDPIAFNAEISASFNKTK